jgi:hypothetical protein
MAMTAASRATISSHLYVIPPSKKPKNIVCKMVSLGASICIIGIIHAGKQE